MVRSWIANLLPLVFFCSFAYSLSLNPVYSPRINQSFIAVFMLSSLVPTARSMQYSIIPLVMGSCLSDNLSHLFCFLITALIQSDLELNSLMREDIIRQGLHKSAASLNYLLTVSALIAQNTRFSPPMTNKAYIAIKNFLCFEVCQASKDL